MSDIENKKTKSFYYSHHVGTILDNKNNMTKFIFETQFKGVAFYTLLLEHLTSQNGISDLKSVTEYFSQTCFMLPFTSDDLTELISKCPDVNDADGTIRSNYLDEKLTKKLKVDAERNYKGCFGRLSNNLSLWIERGDYELIAKNVNGCQAEDITNANAIEWIYSHNLTLTALCNQSGFDIEAVNHATINKLILASK